MAGAYDSQANPFAIDFGDAMIRLKFAGLLATIKIFYFWSHKTNFRYHTNFVEMSL